MSGVCPDCKSDPCSCCPPLQEDPMNIRPQIEKEISDGTCEDDENPNY